MKALILLITLIWGVVFSVVDAWSLPQRSTVSVRNMISKPIPTNFRRVQSRWASPRVQNRMINAAIAYLRNEGIRVVPRSKTVIGDAFESQRIRARDFSVFYSEFSHYWLTLRPLRRSNTVAAVLAPPWVINGATYMAGFATLNGVYKGGLSYSNVLETNDLGAARYRHSVVGIVHEYLHALGCDHESGPNIMHEAAFAEQDRIEGTGRLLPVGPKCKAQLVKFAGEFRR